MLSQYLSKILDIVQFRAQQYLTFQSWRQSVSTLNKNKQKTKQKIACANLKLCFICTVSYLRLFFFIIKGRKLLFLSLNIRLFINAITHRNNNCYFRLVHLIFYT